MTTSLNLAGWAALVGIASAVYHGVLIAPGHILSRPRQALEGAVERIGEMTSYGRAYGVASWLTKSLVDCAWCTSGQLAIVVFITNGGAGLINLVLFTCASIFFGGVAFKFYTHGNKND